MQNNPKYLPLDVSRVLQNVTKYVSKPLGFNKMYKDTNKREFEYASSLPLQIILYYNVFYSFCWIISTCFLWPVLSNKSTDKIQVWIILIYFAFILMAIFEIVRLYLGYIGNLCERVPELTGFWLLTCIIEIPLCCFLLVIVWFPLGGTNQIIIQIIPMQFALQLIHFLFIFTESVLGFISLRVLAQYQISRFHYKQFESSSSSSSSNQFNQKSTDLDWIYNLEEKNNDFTTLTKKE